MHSTAVSSNDNMLPNCPDKPNCVSSLANDEHAIEPFKLVHDQIFDQQILIITLQSMGSKVTITQNNHAIHAEFTSRVFGFVDDVDLVFDTQQKIIHLRSASRTGHFDFGVNRRRIETLRSLLKEKGLIQ